MYYKQPDEPHDEWGRPIKEIKKQLNKKQYGKNKNKLPN